MQKANQSDMNPSKAGKFLFLSTLLLAAFVCINALFEWTMGIKDGYLVGILINVVLLSAVIVGLAFALFTAFRALGWLKDKALHRFPIAVVVLLNFVSLLVNAWYCLKIAGTRADYNLLIITLVLVLSVLPRLILSIVLVKLIPRLQARKAQKTIPTVGNSSPL